MRPTVVGLVVTALAMSVMAGCSDQGSSTAVESRASTAPVTSEPIDAGGSTRVDVTIDPATPRAGVVEVEGTATVPDGSHVNWSVERTDRPTMCPLDVPPEEDPCNAPYGLATVTDEHFAFRVDGLDPGEVEVFAAFDPLFGDQPADVVRRYGPLGHRMTGPQVVDSGGGAFRAQVVQTVTIE